MPSPNQTLTALQDLLSILEDQYAEALIEQKPAQHLHELWDQIKQLRREVAAAVNH